MGRFLVTGCSTGIGQAVVVALAGMGHEVLAGVRRVEDAPAAARVTPLILDE